MKTLLKLLLCCPIVAFAQSPDAAEPPPVAPCTDAAYRQFDFWIGDEEGRDWYDLVWYAANHPELHLAHLEERMRQTGHWRGGDALTAAALQGTLKGVVERLDVDQARDEVRRFVRNPEALRVWSREFFRDLAQRIEFV